MTNKQAHQGENRRKNQAAGRKIGHFSRRLAPNYAETTPPSRTAAHQEAGTTRRHRPRAQEPAEEPRIRRQPGPLAPKGARSRRQDPPRRSSPEEIPGQSEKNRAGRFAAVDKMRKEGS